MKSSNELVLELAESTQEYLGRLIAAQGNLAARFYTDPDQEAWDLLVQFIEGLNFTYQSLLIIGGTTFNQIQFDTMLNELLQAIENKDTVTIADLVSYEWGPWLSAMKEGFPQQ